MTYLCSFGMSKFLSDLTKDGPKEYDDVLLKCKICTFIAISQFSMFASLEGGQLIESGLRDYFSEPWNCLDFTSISLNLCFLMISAVTLFYE